MKSLRKSSLFTLPAVLFLACVVAAAPSLPITKGPVGPAASLTGPMIDPTASRGQWFLDLETGDEEVRTHEFYDNVPGFGGGFAASMAISGIPINVLQDATGAIIAFDVDAMITNDVPAEGQWRAGTNSHREVISDDFRPYEGTLYDTKLTVEFAVDPPSLDEWMASGTMPDPQVYHMIEPRIVAVEPDELGWYCWSPEDPTQGGPGSYLVPTYDFGDIKPGETVGRILSFKVDGAGINSADPRFEAILSGEDIFMNRTTSLKISNWVEWVGVDNGMPYPTDTMARPWLNSTVSVFHEVPEPTLLGLAAMGLGIVLLRRR